LEEGTEERFHRFPWFLPDGRHFLYTARYSSDKGIILLGDLESNERIELAKAAGRAVYVESSGMLLFSSGGFYAGPCRRIPRAGQRLLGKSSVFRVAKWRLGFLWKPSVD